MRYFEARKGRVEIIPMIDIMLFLLVFFIMITVRMIPASGIATHLPVAATAQTLPPVTLVLALRADGTVLVGDRPTDPAGLGKRLAALPKDSQVVIAGSADVPLQALVRVMDLCRQAGIGRIAIAAREGRNGA